VLLLLLLQGDAARAPEADEVALLAEEQLQGMSQEALLAHVRAVQEELCGKVRRSFTKHAARANRSCQRRRTQLCSVHRQHHDSEGAQGCWHLLLLPLAAVTCWLLLQFAVLLLAAAVQRELLKRSFDQLRRTQERLGRRERKLAKEQQKCRQYQQALTAWQASLVPVAPDAAQMAQMAMAAQAAATATQQDEGLGVAAQP
jgi:hypothetical protein